MSAHLNLPHKYNPFLLDDLFRFSEKNLPGRMALHACRKALGLQYLAQEYNKLPSGYAPRDFVKQSFSTLKLDYKLLSGSLENIPETGATFVIANHPFGGIEGMLMIDVLLQRRSDVRIIANKFIKRIPEIADLFIGVNPYGGNDAIHENTSSIREGLRWLQQGGVLVMFPAGDVSSIHFNDMAINDGAWANSVARMAMKTRANVVPVHFEGYNSMAFYLASLIHPVLKTAMLARQIINKRGKTIRLHIGKTVTHDRLKKLRTDTERVAYLRLRSYLLANKQNRIDTGRSKSNSISFQPQQSIVNPFNKEVLEREIRSLPTKQLLQESGNLQVFHAKSHQVPNILNEIGRLREITFRAIGEGTGKEVDLDIFDSFYSHLFLWDKIEHEIIGGYRLGLTDEIIYKYGRKGLYTNSLFKFKRGFIQNIYPAIELGRSFVRPEYQRNFAPLMLLWKGIGSFVASHPQYATLFGPVSISNDYSLASQKLLIEYLQNYNVEQRLKKLVHPRNPCFVKSKKSNIVKLNQPKTLDEVSDIISDIEPDSKGVPILIRQYLKLGGKILGFNLDKDFANAIDGLIRVDLRETNPRILRKYMGHDEAQNFLKWHNNANSKTG